MIVTARMDSNLNIEYPQDFIDKFICGDAVDIMRKIPDNALELIVTSPPYNLKNSTGNGMKDGRGGKWSGAALLNGYSHYRDNIPHDEYVSWQRNYLQEMLTAPFPVTLIERIISSTDAPTVLDPFMGSGTTALAAKNLGRNFIGIEISPKYCTLSTERLNS